MVTKFLQYIKESVIIDFFDVLYNNAPKELQKLVDSTKKIEQNPYWHSEGDVYKHIKLVTNRLHNCYSDINLDLCGFLHDLGKVETTRWDESKKTWTANGHEDVSSIIVDEYKDWIIRMGGDYNIVKWVVDNHMRIKYLDNFRTQLKLDIVSNPYFEYLMKFSSADYGGVELGCKPFMDLTNVKDEVSKYKTKQEENKIVSSKFNGDIIMTIYPDLKGTELGKALVGFKNYIIDKYSTTFNEFVLNNDKDMVLEQFWIYYNIK